MNVKLALDPTGQLSITATADLKLLVVIVWFFLK